MAHIPSNSPKAVCTANQLRSKLDQKLKILLKEDKLVGPQDPYIIKACELGFYDEATRDEFIKMTHYCEEILLTTHDVEVPPFKQLLEWAKMVDEL